MMAFPLLAHETHPLASFTSAAVLRCAKLDRVHIANAVSEQRFSGIVIVP